jgi:hypothetical protein
MSFNEQRQKDIHALLTAIAPQFGGAYIIPVRKAGPLMGMAERTAQNRAYDGTFPVPLVKDSHGRLNVRLLDLAKYLVGEPPQSKRGRPTKEEQRARQQAAGEVRNG